MPFSELSERFGVEAKNRLALALAERRARGAPEPIDFPGAVWADCGLCLPKNLVDDAYRRALERTCRYEPDARGRRELREAVAEYYARDGVEIPPDRILVTPGTSFTYLALFRLLCRPGEEVLCPAPSYPLFDDIAAVAGARTAHYPLDTARGWQLDPVRVETCLSEATRALCLVSPHNPTGAVLARDDLPALGRLAAEHDLPLILDEVFAPFLHPPLAGKPFPRPQPEDGAPLVFLLNGISKMLALPGHKIGWVAVAGDDPAAVERAEAVLEHVCDTFLAASDVAQAAAAELLGDYNEGGPVRRAVEAMAATLTRRRDFLLDRLAACPALRPAAPEGGVYLPIELPEGADAEDLCLRLLERHDLLAHPGYYYHLPGCWLVATFLRPEADLERLAEALGREIA